jgi:hypothetical protein
MLAPDITRDEVEKFKKLLDYFKQLAEDGVTTLIEKQLLLMLDHAVPFFSHLVMTDIFPEIHRQTVNKRVLEGANKRIWNIKELKYPPKEKVKKYGRCNYRNQSILYSSFSSFTANNESQPRVGDIITETVWHVKNNQHLKYCPIFKNQPKGKDVINPRTFEINQLYQKKIKIYPEFVQEQIDSLVQFIADAFTKRVNHNNDLDYIFSAYFSNKIYNDFENGTIEAIYYPSVQDGLSFENLAIKSDVFDEKYELVKVHDSVCVVDPTSGSRGFFFEGLSDCTSFDFTTGKILWNNTRIYQPVSRLLEMKKDFGILLDE